MRCLSRSRDGCGPVIALRSAEAGRRMRANLISAPAPRERPGAGTESLSLPARQATYRAIRPVAFLARPTPFRSPTEGESHG